MVTINLLPWREEWQIDQRQALQKKLLASFLLAAILIFSLHSLFSWQEQKISARLALLKTQKQRFHLPWPEKQIQERLASYSSETPSLSVNDNRLEKTLELLTSVADLPLCFSRIENHDRLLTLVGKATSSYYLSQFLLRVQTIIGQNNMKFEAFEQPYPHEMRFHLTMRMT